MKFLLLPFLEGLLWLLRLLPQKPQPSQVRDTQPEPPTVTPRPMYRPPVKDAIDEHLERHQRIMDAYQRLEASDQYRPAQEWKHVAVPHHQRDLDLVNYLKRTGKI